MLPRIRPSAASAIYIVFYDTPKIEIKILTHKKYNPSIHKIQNNGRFKQNIQEPQEIRPKA